VDRYPAALACRMSRIDQGAWLRHGRSNAGSTSREMPTNQFLATSPAHG
jgi:hypothetical protein